MTNYKINIDKPLPDPSDIQRHKNFDTLYDSYKVAAKPAFWRDLRRKPRYFAGLVAVIALLFLLYESFQDDALMEENGRLIQAPFDPVNIDYRTYQSSTQEDFFFEYGSGSKVHIPAEAFVDAKGNAVSGEVELRYRELRDAADIFISGVPMRYDSADTGHEFESAGMLEILAYQGETPVFLEEGKKIRVEYVSDKTGTDFNLYHLDTVQRNWVYKGKDEMRMIPVSGRMDIAAPVGQIDIPMTDTLAWTPPPLPAKPLKPRKVAEAKKPFGVQLDLSDFPEMQAYKNILWEHNDTTDATNPWKQKAFEEVWHDIKVKRLADGKRYELLFSKDEKNYRAIASPVFEGGEAYDIAMKAYNEKYALYSSALKERQEQEAARERMAKAAKKEYADKKKKFEEVQTIQSENIETANSVVRAFEVDGFGYWNMDKISGPFPQETKIVLADPKGKLLNAEKPFFVSNVYIISPDLKSIRQMKSLEKDAAIVGFDPDETHTLWTVTWDKRLAILRPEDFRSQISGAQTGEPLTIKMEIVEDTFANVAEIKAALDGSLM